jgi:hypothetical protein
MNLWEELTDATNYEFAHVDYLGRDAYRWIEGMGVDLGVEIRVDRGGQSVVVINTDIEAGISLSVTDLLRYGRIAIDYVQFYEYARGAYSHFQVIADALLAMGCGYGFTGSSDGLGIALDYGYWLVLTESGYQIMGEDGVDYYAATPAGCAKAYARAMQDRAVYAWAKQKREVNA